MDRFTPCAWWIAFLALVAIVRALATRYELPILRWWRRWWKGGNGG